jgi:hypothetical protein
MRAIVLEKFGGLDSLVYKGHSRVQGWTRRYSSKF